MYQFYTVNYAQAHVCVKTWHVWIFWHFKFKHAHICLLDTFLKTHSFWMVHLVSAVMVLSVLLLFSATQPHILSKISICFIRSWRYDNSNKSSDDGKKMAKKQEKVVPKGAKAERKKLKTTENGNFHHSYCRLNNDIETHTHTQPNMARWKLIKRNENVRKDEFEYEFVCVCVHERKVLVQVEQSKSFGSTHRSDLLFSNDSHRSRAIERAHTHTQHSSVHIENGFNSR